MSHGSWSITTLPRWARVAAGLLLAFVAAMIVLLALRWPYTKERVIASIEKATGSSVRLQKYRPSYFPEPGCTLENLSLERHAPNPIAVARTITIRSSWWTVLTFRKRIRHIEAKQLHIQVPSPFPPPTRTGSSGGL